MDDPEADGGDGTNDPDADGEDGTNGPEADGGDGTNGPDAAGGTDGYVRVALSALPDGLSPARTKTELDEAVGATAFGCNVYAADEDDLLPWGYHRHPDHEELFYVVAGELAVETPDRTYRVAADEAFFVPPDHRNRARAVADGTRVVAVGAPKESDEAVIEEECPDCGERRRGEPIRVDDEGEGDAPGDGDDAAAGPTYAVRCAACGAEFRRIE